MSEAAPTALCAICQCPLGADEPQCACPACGAGYHADCWAENGGCAVYGCAEVPATEHRAALEIPVSWWGREHKPCPACGGEILAAAVRCRHCGATFQSARPEESAEFRTRKKLEQTLPATRTFVIGLFVACVLPCTAVIAAIVGCFWASNHREELRAMPAIYGVLCRLGIAVGFLQTVAAIIAASLYSILRR